METQNAEKYALEEFAKGFNCAEAVLLGLCRALGKTSTGLSAVATGLGAGVGWGGEICGALTGAAMAIGLDGGRTAPEDGQTKTAVYEKTALLLEAFAEKFGTLRCAGLTGCDMRTPEGREKAKAKNLHGQVCPAFVGFAAKNAFNLLRPA